MLNLNHKSYLKFSCLLTVASFLHSSNDLSAQELKSFEKVENTQELERVKSFSSVQQRAIVEETTQEQLATQENLILKPKAKIEAQQDSNAEELMSEKAQQEAAEKIELLKFEIESLLNKNGKLQLSKNTQAMKARSTVPYYNDQQLLNKVAVKDSVSELSSFDVSAFPLFEKETPNVHLNEKQSFRLINHDTQEKLSEVKNPRLSYAEASYSEIPSSDIEVSDTMPEVGDLLTAYTYVKIDGNYELRRLSMTVKEVITKDFKTFLVATGFDPQNIHLDVFCLNAQGQLVGFVEKRLQGRTSKLKDHKNPLRSDAAQLEAVSIVKVL